MGLTGSAPGWVEIHTRVHGTKGAPVTSRLDDPPVRPGQTTTQRLVLDVALAPGDETAALRVLSLLARRRCRLHRASFMLEPGAGDSGLRLELAAPPGREATVVRWIAGLVSVHGVERVCA